MRCRLKGGKGAFQSALEDADSIDSGLRNHGAQGPGKLVPPSLVKQDTENLRRA